MDCSKLVLFWMAQGSEMDYNTQVVVEDFKILDSKGVFGKSIPWVS